MNTTNHIGFGAVVATLVCVLVDTSYNQELPSLIPYALSFVVGLIMYEYKSYEQRREKENQKDKDKDYV